MRRTGTVIGLAGSIGLAAFLGTAVVAPAPVYAATIVVTTTEDSVAVDLQCSLREAVIAANTNAPVDTCAAGGAVDADSIVLEPVDYELTLAGAGEDLALTGDLDILGGTSICCAGSIDANGLDRIFDVQPESSVLAVQVTLLTGGDAGDEDGGAIRIRQDCPSGVGNSGLSLGYTTLAGNAATNGGAVAMGACARLDTQGVTFMGNSASGVGGALYLDPDASLFTNISTYTGNSAGVEGGAIWGAPTAISLTIASSTIAENTAPTGGGVALEEAAGTVHVLNTILAHNTGGNCHIHVPISGGYNLSSDASCGDMGSNSMENTDPLLDVLDQSPPSYGLLPGSPAIDAGIGEPFPPTDQRDNDRPVDGDGDGTVVLDIGAVEAREPDPRPGTGGLKPTPGELPDTAVERMPARDAAPGVTLAALFLVSGALLVMRRALRQ